NSYRLNIYNIWGNDVKDIAADTAAVNKYIAVTFTVSGLNGQSHNKNSDGTDSDAYFAYLGGECGTNAKHHDKPADAAELTTITGDGTYTVTWNITDPSESISCLYIQTNINAYNLPEGNSFAITVNSIKTDDGVEATTAESTAETTAETTGTTAATSGGTTAAGGTTTTAAKGGSTTAAAGGTTTAAAATSNTATGDASGVGLALAAVVVAGGVALVTKKSK
ncbi:MAG: hypothetical protein IJ595_02275, partial [Oscillospiraceae bacterium]|nr:hypothetical protein [Oscillospiraceae bacterium]